MMDTMRNEEMVPDIPEEEIKVFFSRSSGPGGQNVNKTNTKALVVWNIMNSRTFTMEQKQAIMDAYHTDTLQASNQETRSQPENRERAIRKLKEMVRLALTEEKERIPTKPTIASHINRLLKKQLHSRMKSLRKKPSREEY
jgi:ribosome-associated protein